MSSNLTVPLVESEAEFAQALAEFPLVCVDFFATWCGPCKLLAPNLEKLAAAVPAIKVLKVDVDLLPELAAEHGADRLPTILFFLRGAKCPGLTVCGADVGAIKTSYKELLTLSVQ
jgi:thiol-disulfide isomerase/thioredoxin